MGATSHVPPHHVDSKPPHKAAPKHAAKPQTPPKPTPKALSKADAAAKKHAERPKPCRGMERFKGGKKTAWIDSKHHIHSTTRPCSNKLTKADMAAWTPEQVARWNAEAYDAVAKGRRDCRTSLGKNQYGFEQFQVNTVGHILGDSWKRNRNYIDAFNTRELDCVTSVPKAQHSGWQWRKVKGGMKANVYKFYLEHEKKRKEPIKKVMASPKEVAALSQTLTNHPGVKIGGAKDWATPAEREKNKWMAQIRISEAVKDKSGKIIKPAKVTHGGREILTHVDSDKMAEGLMKDFMTQKQVNEIIKKEKTRKGQTEKVTIKVPKVTLTYTKADWGFYTKVAAGAAVVLGVAMYAAS